MNKRLKAIMATCLTMALGATTLLGCGSKGGETKDGVTEMSVYFGVPGKVPPSDNRILKKLEEITGVKLNFEYLTGESSQRLGVMVAGGEYPDFIDADGSTLIQAGAVIPLEDYIYSGDYPNLYNYLGDDWEKMKDPEDGHIYFMPQFGIIKNEDMRTAFTGEAFWIQKAVLEWAGWPEIVTLDEYFNLIADYKEANPTIDGQPTVGFSILSYDWRSFCLRGPSRFTVGYNNEGDLTVNKETMEAENTVAQEYTKGYYEIINGAYNKGLIDPETFTATYDEYIQKIASGRVLGMVDQQWQFTDAEASLRQQGLLERTYVPIPAVQDASIVENYNERPVLNTGGGLSISVSCKDVEKALGFIDRILAEDVQKLLRWGEESVDYSIVDGKYTRNEEQRQQQKDPDWQLQNSGTPMIWFPHNEGQFDDGNAIDPNQNPDEYYLTLEDYDKKVLDAYGYKTFAEFVNPAPENEVWFPLWSYNIPQGSQEAIVQTKIEETEMKWLPKVIMASEADFDKMWNDYQTELNKLDIASVEALYTKELRRRVDAWGSK